MVVGRSAPRTTSQAIQSLLQYQDPITSVISVSLMREPYSSACNLVISFVPASDPLV